MWARLLRLLAMTQTTRKEEEGEEPGDDKGQRDLLYTTIQALSPRVCLQVSSK
jgi:hypothetical protein